MPPAGFKRSRALWDSCCIQNYDHDFATNDELKPRSSIKQKFELFRLFLRATLYEIQPIRYSILASNASSSYQTLHEVAVNTVVWLRRCLPSATHYSVSVFRNLTTWDQWKWILAIALYYVFLRWIHAMLDAGPLVLIMTILAIIFTVGLSDQSESDGLSAYSVFNKGFKKILGSIDADELLQQHLGGGGMMQMLHRQNPQWNDDEDEQPRRQDVVRNGNIIENPQDENQVRPPPNNNNQNRARRTGKKARRDRIAIEQRREIRAQRDRAMALDLGEINDDELLAELGNRQGAVGEDE